MKRRELTERERAILVIIQAHYGMENSEDEVLFTENDEAVIFVKKQDGSMALIANLTNLAMFMVNGTIGSEEELLRDWLKVQEV